jgi:hypothetical protein
LINGQKLSFGSQTVVTNNCALFAAKCLSGNSRQFALFRNFALSLLRFVTLSFIISPFKKALFSEKLTAVTFYGLILFIFFIFAKIFTYA